MRPIRNVLLLALATFALASNCGQLPARAQGLIPNEMTASTIPPNGDLNPYGVAFVPRGFVAGGSLLPGDVLVSNFNSSSNTQGTGTTIVKVTPHGQTAVF